MEDNRLQVSVTEEEFAAFIRGKAQQYLLKFRKFSVGGNDRFAATWHWPAFLVGFWWLLYRKMYLWAFRLLLITDNTVCKCYCLDHLGNLRELSLLPIR